RDPPTKTQVAGRSLARGSTGVVSLTLASFTASGCGQDARARTQRCDRAALAPRFARAAVLAAEADQAVAEHGPVLGRQAVHHRPLGLAGGVAHRPAEAADDGLDVDVGGDGGDAEAVAGVDGGGLGTDPGQGGE